MALNNSPFPDCFICQGTGQSDTGASYEWGEFITQPCQCLFVEPPLTDEDARQRPWVMVKDDSAHPWHGPRMLAACCPENYFTFAPSKSTIVGFRYCRRATLAELVGAGLEVTE
jgi:hypothetical protein